jgi:hypothetical protein
MEHGALVNAQDEEGYTPLHNGDCDVSRECSCVTDALMDIAAACSGHVECVKVLMRAGGDPTVATSDGERAEDISSCDDVKEVLRGRFQSEEHAVECDGDEKRENVEPAAYSIMLAAVLLVMAFLG